jgi:hypothetical protein
MRGKPSNSQKSRRSKIDLREYKTNKETKSMNPMLSSDSKTPSEGYKQNGNKIPQLRGRPNREERSTNKPRKCSGNKPLSSKTGSKIKKRNRQHKPRKMSADKSN